MTEPTQASSPAAPDTAAPAVATASVPAVGEPHAPAVAGTDAPAAAGPDALVAAEPDASAAAGPDAPAAAEPDASAAAGPDAPVVAVHPAPCLPADLVAPLRADLQDAGYSVEGVTDLLGPVAAGAIMRDRTIAARRVLDRQDPSALAALLRLFSLGDVVDADAVSLAFPRLGVDGVLRTGLLVADGDGYRAACDLRPYGDEDHAWWVASDLSETTTRKPLAPDHVLGVGGASLTLAAWTPRRPVRRVLDLGTGCGVQALHAAAHAESIVATDLSGRALQFAAFNAALAGVDLDLRAGDLFEPVTRDGVAETFDLVVSNPPFVISPRGAGLPIYEYRDGGRAGDTLVQSFVEGVGAHLAPGGVACFLANWEVPAGAEWRDVWQEWTRRPGCADLDVWVVAREYQDVAEYAEMWARDSGQHPDTVDFDRWVAAWLDDFESRDVEQVWFGVVVMQRPAAPRARWVDLTEATGRVASPMGEEIARGLAVRTWLAGVDDADLFERAFVVAPDVTEERHTRPGDSDPQVILIRQGGGFRRAVRADTALAAFVSVCDGELTAGVAASAIGALLGVDGTEVRAGLAAPLRELVADGLLVPAEEDPGR